jgi:hypothetical protein
MQEATEAGAANEDSASRSGQGPAPSASLGGFTLYIDQNCSGLSRVKDYCSELEQISLGLKLCLLPQINSPKGKYRCWFRAPEVLRSWGVNNPGFMPDCPKCHAEMQLL